MHNHKETEADRIGVLHYRSIQDLTGKTFGKWTVLARAPNKGRQPAWFCRCGCGAIKSVFGFMLRNGKSKSCGKGRCNTITHKQKHGASSDGSPNRKPTREYKSWQQMIQRCCNPNHHAYKDYGGRGINVCDRWRNSFASFLADMGPRPPGTVIDRKLVNDNYRPGNCRWATWLESGRNRRGTRYVNN